MEWAHRSSDTIEDKMDAVRRVLLKYFGPDLFDPEVCVGRYLTMLLLFSYYCYHCSDSIARAEDDVQRVDEEQHGGEESAHQDLQGGCEEEGSRLEKRQSFCDGGCVCCVGVYVGVFVCVCVL